MLINLTNIHFDNDLPMHTRYLAYVSIVKYEAILWDCTRNIHLGRMSTGNILPSLIQMTSFSFRNTDSQSLKALHLLNVPAE